VSEGIPVTPNAPRGWISVEGEHVSRIDLAHLGKTTEWLKDRGQKRPDNDPRADPMTDEHSDTAWTDCVVNECREHLQAKLENRFFPRGPREEYRTTQEVQHWHVVAIRKGKTLLQPKPEWPTMCRTGHLLPEECQISVCQVHAQWKAEQWWKNQQEKRIGVEDF